MKRIAIQAADFDVGAELAALEALGGGAVASFTGIVRAEGDLIALELEHYPAMTQIQVERIADMALARWPLLGLSILHRHGRLVPGERIVFVGTTSRHRVAALESCAFLIDWLKSCAPFWKKAHHADRAGEWIAPRSEDDARIRDWDR
ncbi:molybdenum cofactor biosynthesis protein MoaE [Sphingobium sp. AP49]|uniref:molybdenum cofactor biosynthesis protein MoaE n=1 Tax=Sphingobium sp. AP49 TaxID=1144307 RepID=UPI00026ED51E|nr:molybdenum cofactor biosynthesis protein MoaE [Sphingobium sp. AP49]WHO37361.1 molybdenum cofactor biosynthesis protein MoaE [Sphingobium sp. AP49]